MNLTYLLLFLSLTFGLFATPQSFLNIRKIDLNLSDFAYENFIHRNWSFTINNDRKKASESRSLYCVKSSNQQSLCKKFLKQKCAVLIKMSVCVSARDLGIWIT